MEYRKSTDVVKRLVLLMSTGITKACMEVFADKHVFLISNSIHRNVYCTIKMTAIIIYDPPSWEGKCSLLLSFCISHYIAMHSTLLNIFHTREFSLNSLIGVPYVLLRQSLSLNPDLLPFSPLSTVMTYE